MNREADSYFSILDVVSCTKIPGKNAVKAVYEELVLLCPCTALAV